jgi:hypothetical protein
VAQSSGSPPPANCGMVAVQTALELTKLRNKLTEKSQPGEWKSSWLRHRNRSFKTACAHVVSVSDQSDRGVSARAVSSNSRLLRRRLALNTTNWGWYEGWWVLAGAAALWERTS